MHKFFLAGALSCLLVSCNDDTGSSAWLSQPPYQKLTDSIRQHPEDAGLHYRRGSLLYSNNQLSEAEQDLRTAWKLDPQEAYALSVVTVLKKKNADSAIAFLQQAVQKLPSSISLQVGLARGYQQKKQVAEAMKICDNLISRYPGELDARLLKAELLQSQNNNDSAIAVLEKAYTYSPGDVELVHTLAFDYAEAKNPRVLALADSLIKADLANRHAEPYYFKGVYFSNTGHPQEAIRQFDAAIQHDFNFINAYINKGIVYYEQKNYAQALKTFNLAATVSPKAGEPYLWLAKTQEAMGDKEEARLNYQRAYGLDKSLKEE